MKRVVIIGSGLGGLVTSCLLSKRGEKVVVVEHDKSPGGCLQSFVRDGVRFDTGFHYVGGMAEGGPLYGFFKSLGITDLPWKELDGQEIWCGGKCYDIPTGKERWIRYMTSQFPHQKENIKKFVEVCEDIANCPFSETMPYWSKNAWKWLCETIDDPELRNVISGSSLIIELNRETLPLFAFGEIVYSYIHSIHRMEGGGRPVIDYFTDCLRKSGGEIHCSATVTQITEENGRVTGVKTQDGKFFPADTVISTIHPASTMRLLSDESSMRKVYSRRVKALENAMGCFTGNLKLKKGMIAMRDKPVYVHREGSDFWSYDGNPVNHVLVHFYPEQDAVDLITPVAWKYVEKWQGTAVGQRGEEYEEFKGNLLNQCIELAEEAVPGLRNAVLRSWTSTPLTWRDYYLSPEGTSYGIRKDCNNPETSVLLPKTPLAGLFLSGQSIILHGIMGTTISSFITADFLKG